MKLSKISILAGQDKNANPESIERLDINTGEVVAVVGPTGSGKTQLISDIEQYADGSSPTRRTILINDLEPDNLGPNKDFKHLMAEVSQKMNFVIDSSVEAFLRKHARIRGVENIEKIVADVLGLTNDLAGEPISMADNLTQLSGGQARSLMVADVALISNAPVVLIDEIENAGIDRLKALKILKGQGKIVLVVTHDLTLTLMADRRLVMKNGGMCKLHRLTREEMRIAAELVAIETDISRLRNMIRRGDSIETSKNSKEKHILWQKFCSTARLTSAGL
ncbi:ATP-binding cassette domain-containing protein [uncultured Desulfobacter sp.]|uniref:ATP-binding cassette domain-containing protein n=1 Tax=uncultured Desulfobacter sp. TaxID=240139 RepID=UPI002AAB7BA0|nr:ATP-binding cassette domain-containing protein [uncultured Desulfobacter sp.]